MKFGERFQAQVLVDDAPVKEYSDDKATWVSPPPFSPLPFLAKNEALPFSKDRRVRNSPAPKDRNLHPVPHFLTFMLCSQVESTFNAKSTFREEVEDTDPFGEKFEPSPVLPDPTLWLSPLFAPPHLPLSACPSCFSCTCCRTLQESVQTSTWH